MQHFNDYQTFTDTTLVIPLDQANNIGYSTLGLVGEIGEYAEKIHDLIAHNSKVYNSRNQLPINDEDHIKKTTNELLDLLSEVANVCIRADKLKKEIREGRKKLPAAVIYSTEERDDVAKELGDVQWYIARAASALRLTLTDVVSINVKKLIGRIQRGTIQGKGDNR